MKTSNLILISVILICLIFTGAIPITLRYKLRHNDFSVVNPKEDYPYTRHAFKKSEYIVLQGLADCTIITSDSLFLEVEAKESNTISFIQRTDTLIITGKQTEPGVSQKIRLYLPTEQKITARNSMILLRGDPTLGIQGVTSYKIELAKSKLFTRPLLEDKRSPQAFNELTVVGTESSILDLRGVRLNKLTVSDVSRFSHGDDFFSEYIDISYHDKKVVESKGHEGIVSVMAR